MRRDRIYLAALLAAATIAAPVCAQTSTTTTDSTSTNTSSAGTSSSGSTNTGMTSTSSTRGTSTISNTTAPGTTGAFQNLSPGQQKIARSLFEAQQPSATGPAPLSLDQIAAMKQGTGWGQVFKQMKSEGLVGDAKNLGQVVSGHVMAHDTSTTTVATTSTSTGVTTASGRTVDPSGSHSATGSVGKTHGNSAHVSEAHVTTTASGAGHSNAGGNVHAH